MDLSQPQRWAAWYRAQMASRPSCRMFGSRVPPTFPPTVIFMPRQPPHARAPLPRPPPPPSWHGVSRLTGNMEPNIRLEVSEWCEPLHPDVALRGSEWCGSAHPNVTLRGSGGQPCRPDVALRRPEWCELCHPDVTLRGSEWCKPPRATLRRCCPRGFRETRTQSNPLGQKIKMQKHMRFLTSKLAEPPRAIYPKIHLRGSRLRSSWRNPGR